MMLDGICENDVGRKLRVAGRCGVDYIRTTPHCRVAKHRMLTYDAETALVLLHDASNALLIDASLCVDADSVMSASGKGHRDPNVDHRWALERKSYVWVVGYLERVDVSDVGSRICAGHLTGHAPLVRAKQSELPIPMLPAYLPPPAIDPSLVVRAVIIAPVTRDFSTRRVRDMLAGMAEVEPVPYPECAGTRRVVPS